MQAVLWNKLHACASVDIHMRIKPKHRVTATYRRIHLIAIFIVVVTNIGAGYGIAESWRRFSHITDVVARNDQEMLQRMIDVGVVDLAKTREIMVQRRTASGVGADMVGTVGAREVVSEFADRDVQYEVIELWGIFLALGLYHMCLAAVLGLYMLTVRRMENAYWLQRLAAEEEENGEVIQGDGATTSQVTASS